MEAAAEMILIGQYDSPFVRRVGIALRLYGMAFEQRPLSVFGNAAEVGRLNPLMRVPALVLAEGTVLTDSHLILDYLDSLAARPLAPRSEPERHQVLRIVALGTGMAEKAVSLFYERVLHPVPSPTWQTRCAAQITGAAQALEADRGARPGPWWFGAEMSHADIAVACAWRFLSDALPDIDRSPFPALAAHAQACEALPVFQEIFQAFVPPA